MNNNTVYSKYAAEQVKAAALADSLAADPAPESADRPAHPESITIDYADFRIALSNIAAAFDLLCDFDEEVLWSPTMIEAMKKDRALDCTVQSGRPYFLGAYHLIAEARDALLQESGLTLDETLRSF